MGKFGNELIESMQQAAAHAGGRKVSGVRVTTVKDSGRESDPESITYVAAPLRRIVSNSTSDAKKLGTREARTRRTRGGLFAGDSTPAEGSHGSCRQLIADLIYGFIRGGRRGMSATLRRWCGQRDTRDCRRTVGGRRPRHSATAA